MKYLIAVFLLISVSIPNISWANENDEYRAYLLSVIAELQAKILELQSLQQPKNVALKIPRDEFSSIILPSSERVVSRYSFSDSDAVLNIKDTTEKEFFSRFFEIVPDQYDERFKEVVVFKGRSETMDAFVETIPPYTSHDWRFGIREDIFEFEATDKEMTMLFVHEFAHVLGYDGGVTADITDSSSCHEYFVWGCPPLDSYLESFISTFWGEERLDDFVDYGSDAWTKSEREAMFVTTYAATAPEEDFAETFVEFIVETRPNNSSLKHQKINFFYQYPELVKLRTEIRTKL